jgi:hypothetical protein
MSVFVGCNKNRVLLRGLLLLPLVLTFPVPANAQGLLDGRLLGNWIKVGSGDTLKFFTNGDLNVSLSGPATVFSGVGSVERCTDGGANLCLVGPRFKCAYRYAFAEENLNLQLRGGGPAVACQAAAGDFRRIDRPQ